MSVRLHLLGGARIEVDGAPARGRATQRRRLALLALLALAPRRTLTRERVVAYLWPEQPSDAARRLLSESLYVIRRELGDGVLESLGEELVLGAAVGCDVDDFRRAVEADDAATALALYHGPLLDAWYVRDAPDFERWVETERARISDLHVRALRECAERQETAGDWMAAAVLWRSFGRADPYSSIAAWHTARALGMAGERAAALQSLAAHEALLRADLGVGLAPELAELAARLRGASGARLDAPTPYGASPHRSAGRASGPSAGVRDVAPTAPPTPTTAPPAVEGAWTVEALPAAGAPPPADAAPARGAAERTSEVVGVGATEDRPDSHTPGRVRRPWSASTWALSALLLTAVAAWAARDGVRSFGERVDDGDVRTAAIDPHRVAVLYFRDESRDGRLGHLADGLTEGLIRELTGLSPLKVLSQDAVEPFRDRPVPVDSLARRLRAGTIVSASLWEDGPRVRVAVRVVDGVTGDQIAADTITRVRQETVALADALATRVAGLLRPALGDRLVRDAAERLARRRGRSDAALDLLFQAERLRKEAARARLAPVGDTGAVVAARRALRVADSLLGVAEALDPRWPEPAIERARVALAAGRLERGAARVVALAPGLAHAERALTVTRIHASGDSASLARALYLRGAIRARAATAVQTFRAESTTLREGKDDLRAAVRHDPTLAGAWAALAYAEWASGEFRGAEEAAARALEADAYLADGPDVLIWAWRSAASMGRWAEAGRWCARGRELLPHDWHFVECELSLMRADAAGLRDVRPDPARAWAIVRELERIDPAARARAAGHPYSPHYRRLVAAAVTAAAGQRDSARRVLARSVAEVAGDPELSTDVLYDAAFLHFLLGERDAGERALAAYLRARPALAGFIARDTVLAAARRRSR